MRASAIGLTMLSLAVLVMSGCEEAEETAAPIATRSGSYVLRADSGSNNANTYWATHLARSGDTFGAQIGSDGLFTITGLRASGYASPGVLLSPTAGGYSGSINHLINGAGDPAFLLNFTVTDRFALTDDATLTGSINSTAVRSSPAGNLQDTLAFTLLPRPDLTGTGAGRYRLTVESRSGSGASVSPVGATTDLLLAADGILSLNLDQTGGDETLALAATTATTLAGQYSIFDDATVANIRSIPLTLTVTGSGAARVVTAADWQVQRNSSPVTVEEQYTLSAKPLTFFQVFATAPPNNTYELFGGTRTADITIPFDWLDFVDRIVGASDAAQAVRADFPQTLSGSTLTDIELRLDTEATIGQLDINDLRLPIGHRNAGGTQLVHAFVQTTGSDGSLHQNLPTTVTFEFTYTGTNTFGANNARITFASTGGIGIVTFTFNPTE